MEKERKIKTLSLVALVVAVLGLTVAFAALSQTLTINGSASVNAAEWDIHFENLETYAQGNASVDKTPVLQSTTITDMNFTITKPGEYAEIFVDIVNNGTINAKISSIEISKLCTLQSSVESCDWNNDGTVTQEDIDKVNNNISFMAMYAHNNELNGDYSDKNIKQNDILNAKEKRQIVAVLQYDKIDFDNEIFEEATELPKRNLTFNDLSVTINYVQAD